jgi:uncharacterized protein (TIGR03790 family)
MLYRPHRIRKIPTSLCISALRHAFCHSPRGVEHQRRPLFPAWRSLVIFLLSFLMSLCLLPCAHALIADELLIVANSAVPESVELARYYMMKRNVPSGNLLLVNTSDREQIHRPDYDEQIADPVKKFLMKEDPEGKLFKCIVLMYGMPLRVSPPSLTTIESQRLQELRAVLKETEHKSPGGKERQGVVKEVEDKIAELKRDIRYLVKSDWGAAVDSELALVRENTYNLEGWLPNRYFLGFRGKNTKNMPQRVMLVSRLDGPDPAIVRRIIDDSVQVETLGLTGKAYFDARWSEKALKAKGEKQSAYEMYDQAIHNTARILRERGKIPVVLNDQSSLFGPGEAPDAALYCGWYSLGKYVDAFTWAKGAVGFHVASAECESLKKTERALWCKTMLEKGVAATIGPVAEPYLQSFPVPEVFFGCLVDGRMTLAECYGLANPWWSWQQVLIGDPLYRPFRIQ